MIFLDKHGNLSWLFVRNDHGVINGLERAMQYKAPDRIIDLLKLKTHILSLYETEDFESRREIDWDKYLLKVEVLKDDAIGAETHRHLSANYYYAFTDSFPEHGIEKEDILSFQDFLDQKSIKHSQDS